MRSNNHRGERPKLHPSTPSNQISTLIGTCTSFTCLHFYVRGYLLGVLARSEVLARLPAQVLAQSARSGCLLYPSDYLEMARILTTRRLYGRRRRKLQVEPPASPAGPAAVDPTAAVESTTEDDTPFDDSPVDFGDDDDDDFNPDFTLEDGTINDLDALVDQIDLHDDQITPLPIDFNLQELQQADQYDDIVATIEVDELGALPTEPFEREEVLSSTLSATLSGTIPATPSTATGTATAAADDEDDSEFVEHLRAKTTDPTRFRIALGLWCQEAGISRPQYTSLLEILRMPELQQEVSKLPSCLSTLKRQTTAQLPLLPMRKKSIPLEAEQLAKDKAAARSSSQRPNQEDLYFFDPIGLFTAFVRSEQLRNKMYFGLGEFRDNPVELWHSHAWRSSIRTTSGQFAHYASGKPIFPSDVVFFRCHKLDCARGCSDASSTEQRQHIGRVQSTGKDFRSKIQPQGVVVLEIQEILLRRDLQTQLQPPLLDNEGLLSWNKFHFVREDHINYRVDVFLDYGFQDEKLNPDRPRPYPPNTLIIRRIHDLGAEPEHFPPLITPLCKSHPLRGELEIKTFGREHLERFDQSRSNMTTVSLPLMTFIDGFGLYRNSYRTLMGMYCNFGSLSFQERTRRANVVPITLGPHGSNFADVVDALKSLRPLDAGVEVELQPGKKILLCAFTMAYTGDMPQQQKNSGMKTQRANCGCRFCFIDSDHRGDLQLDILEEGRYHHQTMAMRGEMNALKTKVQRERYATKWGFDTEEPCLVKISPALDIILSRPGDPAHSEYNGLTRIMHNVLIDTILTPAAAKSYAAMLRSFPFPPGWPRVQGPLHHLKSYSLSEHARWSVVIPVLLRCFLKEKHIRAHLLPVLRKEQQSSPVQLSPVHQILQFFASAATSNCVLMGSFIDPADRASMTDIVSNHRGKFQQLLKFVADSLTTDPRRARSRSASVAPSRAGSVAPSRAGSCAASPGLVQYESPGLGLSGPMEGLAEALEGPAVSKELAATAKTYMNSQKLPNLHTALHYPTLAEEYAMPANCNVLVGEDKHRAFKKVIYTTNHLRPERDLLRWENIQQTLRLLLADSFAALDNDAAITRVVKDVYAACPTLFSTLLPRSEQLSLEGSLIPETDEDDADVQSDHRHEHPKVIGCIQAKYCKEVLSLPTRTSQLSIEFSSLLSKAYGTYYGMPDIVKFSHGSFQWCKKLSFSDAESQRRQTFKIGDFMMERGRSNEVVRIDQIMVHNWDRVRRLFVKGTRITAASLSVSQDPVLGSGYRRLRLPDSSSSTPASGDINDSTVLIGLPAVLPRQLYIIPIAATMSTAGEELELSVADVMSAQEFLWVERSLEWL